MNNSPDYIHGTPPRSAVVLLNLGTPDAPTPAALRRYLREFLGDARVVEIPRVLWWPLLNGIILPVRSKKSAAKYASIWTADGSPLKVWTDKQAKLLQGTLGERGHRDLTVRYAMTYGQPGVGAVLSELHAARHTRILLLPLYPQFSATTTAPAFDAVYRWAADTRWVPEMRFVNRYHSHPGYIAALAANVQRHWATHGRPAAGGKLVMSFHGVPKRTLLLGDPYHCECHKTARLLAQALNLSAADYVVTFQSRFGKAEWLQPYTEPTLRELAAAGHGRVDVVCPGFSCDHLETLEEISMEVRQAFMESGGKEFHYIPALNDSPAWIAALADIAERHLQGWPTRDAADAQALAQSAERARALGAQR
ncbi:MAG: ferrochelatase [Betaproteobacteria bacterium]|nr:ferrochelatase [Betaproteobacteria bacterium]